MHRLAILGLTFVFALQCAVFAAEENWPQWRGPQGTGVAPAGDYPVKFSNTEGVAWKAKLPGVGTSTPAVWDDQIFVTCGIKGEGEEERDGVLCFDMNGKELWRHEFGQGRKGRSPHASGSNPSPVTDGKNLVVYFKTGTLANLGLDGKEKWKINLQDKFGKDTLWWDLGTSPILVGDRVVVAVMQSGDSYLVALDLKDGNFAWKEKRQYDVPKENDNQIIAWGADHLTGHDAQTGKLLWECTGFNPDHASNWRTIASAVASDGIGIVPYARGESLVAVRLGENSDVTKSAVWEKHGRGQSTDVPTPVVTNGKVYLLTDAGHIDCLKLQTGDVLWSADLPKNRSKFYASPLLAGDKLYCAREDGALFVGQVSETGYKELAANAMDERIIASLVPVRGGLLVRGDEYLYMMGATPVAGR
jgi:outer membrane protein assembly factor BamB